MGISEGVSKVGASILGYFHYEKGHSHTKSTFSIEWGPLVAELRHFHCENGHFYDAKWRIFRIKNSSSLKTTPPPDFYATGFLDTLVTQT